MWIFVDGGIGFPTLSLPPSPDQSAIYAAMATTVVRSGFWGPHSSTTAVPLGREDLWSSMAYGHLWSVPAVREGRRVASVDLPRFTSTLA